MVVGELHAAFYTKAGSVNVINTTRTQGQLTLKVFYLICGVYIKLAIHVKYNTGLLYNLQCNHCCIHSKIVVQTSLNSWVPRSDWYTWAFL